MSGSLASSTQSILGSIGAKSMFAYFQSAAMGGYGVALVDGVTQSCLVISSLATARLWRPRT